MCILQASAAAAQGFNVKRDVDPPKPNFGARPENQPLSESGTGLASAPASKPDAHESSTTPGGAQSARDASRKSSSKMLEWGFYAQPQFITVFTNDGASLNAGGGGALPSGFRNLGGSGALPPGVSANDVTARADGTTTNTTVFRLRRTRLRIAFFPSPSARGLLEIDATPIGTGSTFVRHALATGVVHASADVRIEFSAGITRLPLTLELNESSRDRPFMERSTAVRALWPGETDTGLFIRTVAFKEALRLNLGVVNGVTLAYPTFAQLPDLDRGKDAFVSAFYTAGPVTGNVSVYGGTGQTIENNVIRSFPRQALNVGAAFKHTFAEALGETRASAEFKVAHNMDRGFVYPFAAPKPAGSLGVENRNGRAFYLRAEQELTRHALLGLRYDTYVPNVHVDEDAYQGFGVVAAVRFGPSMTLGFEYLYAKDTAHDASAAVLDRKFHVLSSYFQVRYDP
jgi:hypothetical protein